MDEGVLQARSEGWCAVCGQDYGIGDWIQYDDNGETIHDACGKHPHG